MFIGKPIRKGVSKHFYAVSRNVKNVATVPSLKVGGTIRENEGGGDGMCVCGYQNGPVQSAFHIVAYITENIYDRKSVRLM